MAPPVPSRRSSQDGVARRFASLALHTACLWRRRSPRFVRHMTALLIASLLLRCIPRVPVAPSDPCFARHMTASLVASLLLCCMAPSVPSLRSSQDGVAHYFASPALQTGRRSLRFARHMRRRSLLRFSCVAYRVCPWRRQSPRFARHMTALLIASLLLRCKRRVPVAPSVPSLRSSHDGVAYCFASVTSHTACACGAVGPFALLVTLTRLSSLRFSCVANHGVCL